MIFLKWAASVTQGTQGTFDPNMTGVGGVAPGSSVPRSEEGDRASISNTAARTARTGALDLGLGGFPCGNH